MSWTWRYEDAGGAEVAPEGAPRSATFTTQGDAETWLGETWRDLLSAGVAQVSLLDNGQVTYTMGLDAPQ
jgi:hypothetical protein